MSNKSIMGFLFQKSAAGTSGTRGPVVQRNEKAVIEPVPITPFNRPEVNTFTLSERDLETRRPVEPEPDKKSKAQSPEPLDGESEGAASQELPDGGEAAELVHRIREALVPQGDFLSIPAEAVLANLPESLRGPRWPGNKPTGINLLLDKEPLLEKLRSGVIRYHLGEFLPDLEEGWAADVPMAEVTLDLPTVVNAIPSAMFGPGIKSRHRGGAETGQRDYFTPAPIADAVPPINPASASGVSGDKPVFKDSVEPTNQAEHTESKRPLFGTGTGPKRQVVPTRIPGAWDGVESGQDASVAAVDLNLATFDALQALPGVGPQRARMILEDRERRGPFDGIYDLLRIRGIGRRRFVRLTGLSLRRRDRRDRHELLNELIGLPLESRPGLPDIVCRIAHTLECATCSLVGPDGVVMSSSAPQGTDMELRAAMVPVLFRRTTRYLQGIAPGASDCVVLPFADPPLLLFAVDRFFLVIEASQSDDCQRIMSHASSIARELSWLLSPHAVVR